VLPPTPEPQVPRVKAELDIAAGTVLTSTDGLLTTEMVPVSQFMTGVNLSSVEEARDMVATSSLKANDAVRKDQLRKAGLAQKIPAPKEGEQSVKAFPVQVNSLSGVADLVMPGDFVDVLASFNLDVATFTPGIATGETGTTQSLIERPTNEGTTKVLLQDVEVLDVIKPAPPTEDGASPAPQPEAAPADGAAASAPANPAAPTTAGNTLTTGNWIIVIAVSNQEAEVLRFSLDRGIGITTVLRRAGDHTTERTVGATMRVLVDSYGMPMPSFPQVVQQPAAVKIEGVPELPQVKAPSFSPTATTNTNP
jgi:pilus assembly protein CpaB